MELKITNEPIAVNETILDSAPEQAFENDLILPDYFPPIQRILKCLVIPKISQCFQNGDQVNIDGFALVKVYYLSPEQKIHCYDSKIPFAKILEIRSESESVHCIVHAKTDYVNCRAVSPRRLDIRGAISIPIRVIRAKSENILSNATENGIQLKKIRREISNCTADFSKIFTIREQLDADVTKSPIVSVLRCDAVASATEVRVIPNKVILKGDLKVTTLYCSEDADLPETFTCSLPISQILDIDQINDNCKCDVFMDVLSAEITSEQDEDGINHQIMLEAKINTCVQAVVEKEISVINDAYSTDFECRFQTCPLMLEHLMDMVNDTMMVKEELALTEEPIERIIDLWCYPMPSGMKAESSRLIAEIPIQVYAFYRTESGEIQFAEKTMTAAYSHPITEACEFIQFDPKCSVLSCSYSFSSPNQVQVRCELQITGGIFCRATAECINELSLGDPHAKKGYDSPALTIYYCTPNEDIWEIAKHYNTCCDKIKQENGLEEDQITEQRILLIPSAD